MYVCTHCQLFLVHEAVVMNVLKEMRQELTVSTVLLMLSGNMCEKVIQCLIYTFEIKIYCANIFQ